MRTKEQHKELLAQSEASRVPADSEPRDQLTVVVDGVTYAGVDGVRLALDRQKKKSEALSFCFLVTLAGLALLAGFTVALAVYFA